MLIESEDLLARINKCYQESAKTGLGLEPVMAIRDIKALISVIPEVDAAPVKHGRWIPDDEEYQSGWVCNQCYGKSCRSHCYCPHCGAKMDLEGNDAQTDQPGK